MLRFPRIDAAELETILRREAPQADQAQIHAAIAAAEGSPGRALDFVGQELGKVHRLMQQMLEGGDGGLSLRGELGEEVGARPDRERLQAVIELARSALAGQLADALRERQERIIAAHQALGQLAARAPIYNFDPGLLVMEIGGLLASAALPREAA